MRAGVDHALQRHDFRIECKIRAGQQRGAQALFDVDLVAGLEIDRGKQPLEPVGAHRLEQRGLAGEQTIERLGRDAGAARQFLGAGRRIAVTGKGLPRNVEDDSLRLLVAA